MIEIISQILLFIYLYFLVFMLMTFIYKSREIENEEIINIDWTPEITFLIPGWNEAKSGGITNSINSIQSLNYPREKIKIIFIDNNSTDNTREIVDDIVKNDNRVMYIFEKRQGKHHAINTGIDNVNTNYLAIMDADTVLDKDSLIKPIQLLKDDNAMVICSHNIVHKDENILQMAQRAEFTISIFWRKMYSTMDAIQVLPGPYTIFNKKVFDNIGNYKDAHKAEDFEMTLRLHKHHYKIMNPLSAIARTTGPSTIRGLYRQRLRWFGGIMANIWDYRSMFFKKRYGDFAMFTLPFVVIFFSTAVIAFLFSIYNIIVYIYDKILLIMNTDITLLSVSKFDLFYFDSSMLYILIVFALFVLLFVLYTAKNMIFEKNNIFYKFIIMLIVYPLIMPYFVLVAFIKFIFKREVKWTVQDNKLTG